MVSHIFYQFCHVNCKHVLASLLQRERNIYTGAYYYASFFTDANGDTLLARSANWASDVTTHLWRGGSGSYITGGYWYALIIMQPLHCTDTNGNTPIQHVLAVLAG
jgi:hypothetical protein